MGRKTCSWGRTQMRDGCGKPGVVPIRGNPKECKKVWLCQEHADAHLSRKNRIRRESEKRVQGGMS